jgi:glutamine synthetase
MQEISWAPVFQAWGYNNRTLMARLPNRRCLEVRTADSAVNFYLGAALVLAAGLDGIRHELNPADPVNIDTYKVSEKELAGMGVRRLPWTSTKTGSAPVILATASALAWSMSRRRATRSLA